MPPNNQVTKRHHLVTDGAGSGSPLRKTEVGWRKTSRVAHPRTPIQRGGKMYFPKKVKSEDSLRIVLRCGDGK
jgi:hypothetical protein